MTCLMHHVVRTFTRDLGDMHLHRASLREVRHGKPSGSKLYRVTPLPPVAPPGRFLQGDATTARVYMKHLEEDGVLTAKKMEEQV